MSNKIILGWKKASVNKKESTGRHCNRMRDKVWKSKPMYKIYWNYNIMLSYWLKYKNNLDSKKPKFSNTSNGRIIFSSECEVCNS